MKVDNRRAAASASGTRYGRMWMDPSVPFLGGVAG